MSTRRSQSIDNPKTRLSPIAREALASVVISGRRLVAFTGSGTSLIYGGVTWGEAVKYILDDTIFLLKTFSTKRGIDRFRLKRTLSMLMSFEKIRKNEQADPSDFPIALEICEEARQLIRNLDKKREVETVNEIFAQMAESDTRAIRLRLIERIRGNSPQKPDKMFIDWSEKVEKIIKKINDDNIQILSQRIYSLDWIEKETSLAPSVRAVLRNVKRSLNKEFLIRGEQFTDTILPVDRRSLMAPFLALLQPTERLKAAIASQKSKPTFGQIRMRRRPLLDPLKVLSDSFRVERYITLNYDWEIEKLLMIGDLINNKGRDYTVEQAAKDGHIESEEPTIRGSRRVRRLPDGKLAATDVYRPQANAHLFEFALNSPDHAVHIVHLHGRADAPENMVARDEDYNRIYRRDTSNPRSLERALDVALTGNPILFVGVGLQEAEITRALRQLVANSSVTPDNPAFALLPLKKDGLHGWREQVAYHQRFGLHIIHYGDPMRGAEVSLPTHLSAIENLRERAQSLTSLSPPENYSGSSVHFSKLRFIREMPGDNIVFRWLRALLTKSTTEIRSTLFLQPNELPDFAAGCVDYFDRLRSKILNAALEFEIRSLAIDVKTAVSHVVGTIIPRESVLIPIAFSPTLPIRRERHFNYPEDWNEALSPQFSKTLESLADTSQWPRGNAVVLGESGCGKGDFLRHYLKQIETTEPQSSWLVSNFNFGIEIDGAIGQIFSFLNQVREGGYDDQIDRLRRIASMVRSAPIARKGTSYLIFTGIDRLFDDKSIPISADFERLLKIFFCREAAEGIRFVVIASPKFQAWLRRLRKPIKADWLETRISIQSNDYAEHGISKLFRMQLEKVQNSLSPKSKTRSQLQLRLHIIRLERSLGTSIVDQYATHTKALLKVVLDHWSDIVQHIDFPNRPSSPEKLEKLTGLDMAVINLLAFVGAPLSQKVIVHDPAIRRHLRSIDENEASWKKIIVSSINRLSLIGLIKSIPAQKFDNKRVLEKRIVLHRVVLGELRERLGVPLGDAMLSNTFSLSLAASLPVDVILPDSDVRKRLKEVIGYFRSAWKDISLDRGTKGKPLETALNTLLGALESDSAGKSHLDSGAAGIVEDLRVLGRMLAMREDVMSACLRASANIVRSFFSATSLVTIDPEALTQDSDLRSEFEAHKRRIQDLFTRIRELQSASEIAESRLESVKKNFIPGTAETDTALATLTVEVQARKTPTGRVAPPLYGGELIWLHNERGVISLIQGDLYEAEFSFEQAKNANITFKGSQRGHYANRIDVNRSFLLIERGHLRDARSILNMLRGKVHDGQPNEARLLIPIIEGHLGLVAHLNGRMDDAKRHYLAAILGLAETEQVRALGSFRILWASFLSAYQQPDHARHEIAEAIRSAEAGRQLDVLWRARLMQAKIDQSSSGRQIVAQNALDYATRAGVHRLAVEALVTGAEIAANSKNFEMAADQTAKAMILATRYGMTLRRITLRVTMGRYMLNQQDAGGAWLLRRAIAHADRIGYQSAIQRAQEDLVMSTAKHPY